VCRKSYIHPAVLEVAADDVSAWRRSARRGLNEAETRLLRLLEGRIETRARSARARR
jgi:DNA topoisomerase IB